MIAFVLVVTVFTILYRASKAYAQLRYERKGEARRWRRACYDWLEVVVQLALTRMEGGGLYTTVKGKDALFFVAPKPPEGQRQKVCVLFYQDETGEKDPDMLSPLDWDGAREMFPRYGELLPEVSGKCYRLTVTV